MSASVSNRFDAVVIGAGIVGAAAAAALARRGLSVVILEKENAPGLEASGRAQGSLRIQGRPACEIDMAIEAMQMFRDEARDAAGTDADFELVVGGNLYIGYDEAELATLRGLVADAHRMGLTEVALLAPDEVRKLLPAATGPFGGAMWSSIDGQCQPEKATAYFIKKAIRAGAELRCATKVLELEVSAGRVTGVRTSTGPIGAARVALCGGIWSPYLAASVGVGLPIMPLYLSELETDPLPPLFDQAIRAFGFGARQTRSGRLVVSAGLSARKFHRVSLYDLYDVRHWIPRLKAFRRQLRLSVDFGLIARQIVQLSARAPALIGSSEPPFPPDRPTVDGALAALQRLMPAAAAARGVRYWTGATDMTPDGLPIIDGDTGIGGLAIAAAFSGRGLGTAPVVGEIIADLAVDGRSRRPITAFSNSRFAKGAVKDMPSVH